MEVCGKSWLINWLVWSHIIINPPQFYYSDSSRGSHLLHSPWAPESTVHAVLLPFPYQTIIKSWLENTDHTWEVHENVISQECVRWKVEGENKQWPQGGEPIFETAYWPHRCQGPVKMILIAVHPFFPTYCWALLDYGNITSDIFGKRE